MNVSPAFNMKNKKAKWLYLAGLILLWLIGAIGVGMTVAQTKVPSAAGTLRPSTPGEITAAVFQVIGSLSVVLTLYFYIWTSIETRVQTVLENTFALLRSWDEPSLLSARRFLRELRTRAHKTPPVELVAEINSQPDLRQSIVLMFNFVEHVAFSIKSERVDGAMIRKALARTLTDVHQRYYDWIQAEEQTHTGYAEEVQEHINIINAGK